MPDTGPTSIDQLVRSACVHHQAGRTSEAITAYRRAIEAGAATAGGARGAVAAAQFNLGLLLADEGRLDEAIVAWQSAVATQPGLIEAHRALGRAQLVRGRPDEAVTAFRRMVQLQPGDAAAHLELARALAANGQHQESLSDSRRAFELAPTDVNAQLQLGTALAQLARWDEAAHVFRELVDRAPQVPAAWSNLGSALARLGQTEEAGRALERAVELRPDFADAHSNLGALINNVGRYDEGMAHLRRAIELSPKNATAHWNLAMAMLRRGDFAAGWTEAEWRWGVVVPPHGLPQPLWNGQPLGGKPILLHAEQGRGDTIQFARYAPMVAARGGRVILRCQRELVRLLRSISGVERIITTDDALPPIDLQCPLQSLPLAFGTDLSSIPASLGYLRADDSLIERWRARLQPRRPAALRVGLVWSGDPLHQNDRNRSVPLTTLAPLADVAGIEFASLQMGSAAAQIQTVPQLRLIDHTDELTDFADTAALVANLDLVIAVDTAVAHLSAAMGRPTWLLLPLVPDWRWLLDRNDSPWYPTARLFRQPIAGDWASVVNDVAEQLRKMVERKNAR
jgi:tetratricopeptide (TPR) repeat protein